MTSFALPRTTVAARLHLTHGVARSGEITATNGVIDQSNFYDYPVARINEAPFQTNVHIVESSAPPGGASIELHSPPPLSTRS